MKVIASCGNSFGVGSFSSWEEDVTHAEGHRIKPGMIAGQFLGIGYASSSLRAQNDDYVIVHTRDNPLLDHSMADKGQWLGA